MDSNQPKVSIIIVNYNGCKFLGNCLESISKLDYPKSKIEVLVIDNGSFDGSVNFVKKNYLTVKLVALTTNTGFTGGNNEGIRRATGDFLILLNNDTKVEKNWLKELVKAASDPTVGIVSSKVILAVPYIRLQIKSTVIQQSDLDNSTDFSPKGTLIENIKTLSDKYNFYPIWYENGFYESISNSNLESRWTHGDASVLLPLNKLNNIFSLLFHGYKSQKELSCAVRLYLGKKRLTTFTIIPNTVKNLKLVINKKAHSDKLIWLVQNAGNTVMKSGFSKDRGSVIRISSPQNLEFYEEDCDYFDQPVTLAAACGAAMLIKRAVINDIGKLDGHYFMYYEDIDFSLRALKKGWKIKYAPKAKVYHLHRASSGKLVSAFFISLVEKNHLLLVFTHFPIRIAVKELIHFLIRLFYSITAQLVYRFFNWKMYPSVRIKASGRLEAFIAFYKLLPTTLWNRYWWQKKSIVNWKEIEKLFY